MAFVRIKFNTSASHSGAFILLLNPVKIDTNVDYEHTLFRTLDGGQIIQDVLFDSRPFVLSWVGVNKGAITGFSTMLATLDSYRGSIRYINFGSVEPRITATGWIKTRVTDLKINLSQGGAIKYNVEMILTPEPT